MQRPLLILTMFVGFFTLILLAGFLLYSFKKSTPVFLVSTSTTQSIVNTSEIVSNSTTENVGSTSEVISNSTSNGVYVSASSQIPQLTPLKITALPPKSKSAAIPTLTIKGKVEVMAWIYPGAPTCSAKAEYSDGRKIDILKPEYFTINSAGKMILLTEKDSGCNAYSVANVADLKKHSSSQYATFSSSYAGTMDIFLSEALVENSNIDKLVSFAVDNKITGIEIDFEDFGGWTAPMYDNYKKFITKLGTALHSKNKKLMIDGPATSNAVEESWYFWRYADFNKLPVDKIVIMIYDYQFDQGVGVPVSPISWMKNTVKWTLGKFSDKTKISIGIPSYGYKGVAGSQKFSLLTQAQLKAAPGFSKAVRDAESGEMTWRNGDNVYFYQDGQSLLKKLQAVQGLGINSVSVWHLGGNVWFSKN